MAILDRQGRLFGKVNILDLGAIAIVLLTIVGLAIVPDNSGKSLAQIAGAEVKPVEVEIMVRGLTVLKPNDLIRPGDTPNIIIRNQRRGKVTVKAVEALVPKVPVPLPNGTVKAVDDPRLSEIYVRDFAVTLEGNASITSDGVVLGGEKVKVGIPIDLESPKYFMRGSVMDVRS